MWGMSALRALRALPYLIFALCMFKLEGAACVFTVGAADMYNHAWCSLKCELHDSNLKCYIN